MEGLDGSYLEGPDRAGLETVDRGEALAASTEIDEARYELAAFDEAGHLNHQARFRGGWLQDVGHGRPLHPGAGLGDG